MKIKGVDFPEPLLNALRDGRLVVFAGAGVSMGPPAGLPDFRRLAEWVAEGTVQPSKTKSETDDQFLGRLKDREVQVHQRTTDVLQRNNPQSNALHRNLLRLFKKTGPVRVVTTNFDRLFEQAAKAGDLFQTQPKVFEAPALPPASRFQGIVHLHGSVNEPEEMVLTHRDFGCAYLTEEDGWARRFLVSLFANHTVLFVGYSHSDTIMTYLTPSLPPDGKGRFALVGSESGDPDRWRRMGIEPVVFPQKNKCDFAGLDAGVEGLADFEQRGFLDWKRKITKIAEGEPPMVDDEASHVINHALTREELTRFFVNAAQSSSWINWLDQRGRLKRFFSEGSLQEHDVVLARWSALPFKGEISTQFLSIISDYHERLNYRLWKEFVLELGYAKNEPLDSKTLSRWIHILMNCIPTQSADEHYSLLGVAEHCANAGEIQCLLQVYDAATANLVRFLSNDHQDIDDSWCDLWRKLSARCLPQTAHTLLERTTIRLEQRHSARIAWNQGDHKTDRDSDLRSAIEPHEQDQRLHRIDPLIDVARDCLGWLATHDLIAVRAWCDRFSKADAPLLRRLAIHTTNARQDLSPDDRMTWLLEHCNVNEFSAHHEIFHMARHVYPQASDQKRKALIQKIYNGELTRNINDAQFAYYCFTWFYWLLQADPSCEIVKREFDKTKEKYPEFRPIEHPDFTSYLTIGSIKSPWTVERLLAKSAHEWLPELLNYQPDQDKILFQSREAMLVGVSQTAKSNMLWGLDLADAMAAASQWDSDLWPWVIGAWAWREAELDQDNMRRILSHLSNSRLYRPRNVRDIAHVLKRLIRGIDVADLTQWLGMLHEIAIVIHPCAVIVEDESTEDPQDRNWLREAINHAPGKLAEFWIYSIAHWYEQQEVPPQALSSEYRRALDTIIQDNGIPGKLGRTILVSQFDFLHNVDSVWTEDHLLPLFDSKHEDFACAWDGFLIYGGLSLQTLELLQDKLIGALQRAIQEFPQQKRSRFIQFYVIAWSWLIQNTNNEWIGKFFEYAQENAQAKHEFTYQVRLLLRDLDESQQQEWWNVWLKDYWKNRLEGVPCPLEDRETAEMFEWVIYLQGVFPEVVDMAVRMKPVTLEDCSSLLHRISQSNLIDRHPNELAKFLIHLGSNEHLLWFWKTYFDVICQLSQKDLPTDLAEEIRELIVRIEHLP